MKDPDEDYSNPDGRPHNQRSGAPERGRTDNDEGGFPKVALLHSTQMSLRSERPDKELERYQRYGIMRLLEVRPTHQN